MQETPVEQADTAAGLHGLLVSYCQMEYDEDGNVIFFPYEPPPGCLQLWKTWKTEGLF